MRTALVTGAGGFIGHHLVMALVGRGYRVRGVDITDPAFAPSAAHEFRVLDLRNPEQCRAAVMGVQEVYHLAADMGGIGYITAVHAGIAHNNTLMDLHMLEASRAAGIERFFLASSACVYPQAKQTDVTRASLREGDAFPADPEEGYGWAKLYSEKLCQYYREDHGLATRVARFHNVYGPFGAFEGGKEKVPAAICRKVALAPDGGEIEVWGDGQQVRSFMYVDDCVEGIIRLTSSEHDDPVNLGTDQQVTIDHLVALTADIAGKRIVPRHDTTRPQGVRARNSDNARLREILHWEPRIPLQEGLTTTYRWIEQQLRQAGRVTQAPDDSRSGMGR